MHSTNKEKEKKILAVIKRYNNIVYGAVGEEIPGKDRKKRRRQNSKIEDEIGWAINFHKKRRTQRRDKISETKGTIEELEILVQNTTKGDGFRTRREITMWIELEEINNELNDGTIEETIRREEREKQRVM